MRRAAACGPGMPGTCAIPAGSVPFARARAHARAPSVTPSAVPGGWALGSSAHGTNSSVAVCVSSTRACSVQTRLSESASCEAGPLGSCSW